MKREKLLCMDGLKGIGAFVIAFVWHYRHFAPENGFPLQNYLNPLYEHGWLMVEFFFVLSGIGMTLGYENKILNGEISLSEFMKRRVKYIFPLMWLTLFVTLILEGMYKVRTGNTFVYPNFDIYHFFLNLFGMQNGILELGWSFNSPSWCVSILLCCYFVFYFCVQRVKKDNIVSAYVVIALAGCVTLVSGFNYLVLNSLMGRGFSCFFIGAIVAKIYMNRGCLRTKNIGYASFVIVCISAIMIIVKGTKIAGNLHMALIIGIIPFLSLAVLFIPWLSRLFSLKIFVDLGKISLPIYLWHFPIQCLIKNIEVYCRINIPYSSKFIWLIYVIMVLGTSILYKIFLEERLVVVIKKFLFLPKC